jgi:predicted site-specific integrase-resolvase
MSAAEKKRGVLLTQAEIADRIGRSPYTLQKWRQKGGGPPYIRMPNNAVRYPEEGLLEWIEAKKVTSVTEERIRNNKAGVDSFPGSTAGGFQ